MDMKISDAQILQIAEKQIKDILKPKVEEVLKDKYWMRQRLYEYIQDCIYGIMKEKVEEELNAHSLEKMINKQDFAKMFAENIANYLSSKFLDE